MCMFGLSKIQSYNGLSVWHNHERGSSPWALHARERERELKSEKNGYLRNNFASRTWECSQLTSSLRSSSRTCMHATTRRGTRSAHVTCSQTVTCRSTGDRDSAPLNILVHKECLLGKSTLALHVACMTKKVNIS